MDSSPDRQVKPHHRPTLHAILSFTQHRVRVGARLMRYNFDRSLALLMLIGSILVVLWIVVGYSPQGLTTQSTPRQQTARAD